MSASSKSYHPGPRNLITDVAGVAVGNAEDHAALTGTTVLLVEDRAIAAVDVRGGAPGTRETDLLDPGNLVDAVDAVVLSGGSVYGLDAASAVTAWLGARGRGFAVREGVPVAPIVPAAILFDLANGGDKSWGETPPYLALGRAACEAAGETFALGSHGAGLGAVAGDLKGGLGSASIAGNDGLVIGALVAVNAVGAVAEPGTGRFWAAPFEIDGEFGERGMAGGGGVAALSPVAGTKLAGGLARAGANTTVAVVATNARLDRAEARRLAIMACDGFARAIRPSHTPFDGDTVFALATGAVELAGPRSWSLAILGALAADTLSRAVARGVFEAEPIPGVESYRQRHP